MKLSELLRVWWPSQIFYDSHVLPVKVQSCHDSHPWPVWGWRLTRGVEVLVRTPSLAMNIGCKGWRPDEFLDSEVVSRKVASSEESQTTIPCAWGLGLELVWYWLGGLHDYRGCLKLEPWRWHQWLTGDVETMAHSSRAANRAWAKVWILQTRSSMRFSWETKSLNSCFAKSVQWCWCFRDSPKGWQPPKLRQDYQPMIPNRCDSGLNAILGPKSAEWKCDGFSQFLCFSSFAYWLEVQANPKHKNYECCSATAQLGVTLFHLVSWW